MNINLLLYKACYTITPLFRAEIFPAIALKVLGKTDAPAADGVQAIRDRKVFLKRVRTLKAECSQLAKDGGLEQWRTPCGDFWIPRGESDDLFYFLGEELSDLYETLKGVILDCGANVGVYTVFALRGSADKVIAFKPDPLNLECLHRNLAINPRKNDVHICPKGVWDKPAELPMLAYEGHRGSSSFIVDAERSEVVSTSLQLTTIDRVVEELGLENVDYIKMDVEGAERNAVQGAAATIKKFKPKLALSLYHRPDDPSVLRNLVASIEPEYQEKVYYHARLKPTIEASLGVFTSA